MVDDWVGIDTLCYCKALDVTWWMFGLETVLM